MCIIVLCFCGQAIAESNNVKLRMGYTLFNPAYEIGALDGWVLFGLTSTHRNLLNITNSSDLLSSEISSFSPSLGVDGRETALSINGIGPEGTRLEWRGRPMRNPRNCRADFNRISPLSIGAVRSASSSMLSGVIGTGGTVEFSPIRFNSEDPVTALHHRDGYYGYEPVEFIHSRRILSGTYITTGGYFANTGGKVEHSRHEGHIIWGELTHQLTGNSIISATMMNRRDKTGITLTDRTINFNDNDWDLEYDLILKDSSNINISGYRTWRTEDEAGFHDYVREAGIDVKFSDAICEIGEFSLGSVGADIRIGRLDIEFPDENDVLLTEIEASAGWRNQYNKFSMWAIAGGYGWGPDRIRLNWNSGLEYFTTRFGSGHVSFSQAVNPHSPEIMFADYKEERPSDDLIPMWRVWPELPIKGKLLPVSISINQEIGWKYEVDNSELLPGFSHLHFDVTAFRTELRNPVVWTVENNNLLTPFTAKDRLITGWRSNLRLQYRQYRGSISMIGLNREDQIERGVPILSAEPTLRMNWEAGWHIFHWGDDFEGDISLGGQFYNSFISFGVDSWERIGGAYPLDFKLSMRIYGFTLYWGLHNWNSYVYRLVPGYKMIHKEEYFGIHWLLFN